MKENTGKMRIRDHFEQLRYRLILAVSGFFVTVILCFFVQGELMDLVLSPLQSVYDKRLAVLDPSESILQYLKVNIVFGVVLASPWIMLQIWQFVGKGLYSEERKVVYLFSGASLLLFLGGVAFSYFFMMPMIIRFLVGFDPAQVARTQLQFSRYVNFFFKVTLILGFVFLLPVFMVFLDRIGAVGTKTWRGGRKFFIVIAFLLAALISPPDPISQVAVAIPFLLLYELGLGVIWLLDW